jgi:hypothetical protein
MDIEEWTEEPAKIEEQEKTEEFSMTHTIVDLNAEAGKTAEAEGTEETVRQRI